MAEEEKVRKRRRWPWIVAGALAALVVALVLLTPAIIVAIDYPTLTFDLAPYLQDAPEGLVSNKTVSVDLDVSRGTEGQYIIRATGRLLDWPFSAWVNVLPSFRFVGVDVTGSASFHLDDTPLHLLADFTASSSGEWHAEANTDKTAISATDPLVAQILSRLQMQAISNLVFNGTFDFSAKAERTATVPVPQWKATCRLSDINVSCDAGGMPITVENLRMKVGATGIANHRDIMPIFPRADRITASGFVLSNVFAQVYATERTMLVTNDATHAHASGSSQKASAQQTTNVVKRSFLVSEASARCCGGDVKLYNLFLNEDRLNITLFVDGIDTGAALRHLKSFHGDASGRLYGKLPLRYRKDEHQFRLSNVYLHSVPGETGNLRVYDPKPIVDNLAMGGVPQDTCDNLSKALTDLAYDVLKVSLQPDSDGGMALTLKIAGKSTHGTVTVPVSLEVTFHGDLEQILNTGFRTFNQQQGRKK